MIDLSDEDLKRMCADTENNFVERKTTSDKKGWLQTAVAFANSTPIGLPAVLFVGLKNDGTFENTPVDYNWEELQKTVTQQLNRAYPPIYFIQKVIRDGVRQCLGVIIPGSIDRPHFAGKSYVRVGPETSETSDMEFDVLITERNSKAYAIRKWIGQQISVASFSQGRLVPQPVVLIDCNQYYFTAQWESPPSVPQVPFSHPLNRTEVSYNHTIQCLQLEVRDIP